MTSWELKQVPAGTRSLEVIAPEKQAHGAASQSQRPFSSASGNAGFSWLNLFVSARIPLRLFGMLQGAGVAQLTGPALAAPGDHEAARAALLAAYRRGCLAHTERL